ncbi:unnamed protein product [Cuscuta europaea]|uniref:Uncharacterized protein n=1 Tax=Cuscuta europaea TaxID=41803 RepID=A0A9P0ZM37_CUSEU|nr:unnamed protein product [Cuscuta europaea]
MASSITTHPICSVQSSKEGRETLKILHFLILSRTKNKGGRRRGKEKRKVGFGEENLSLARNFHGVEKVAGVVAGVRRSSPEFHRS